MSSLSPALVPILGAILVPFLRGRLRDIWMLALPVVGLVWLLNLPDGNHGQFTYLGLELTPVRVDAWSRVFAIIFFIAAFVSVIYALHVREWTQQVAGLVYAGAGVGAVLSGDFVTTFVYWELMMVGSLCLIWASKTKAAFRASMRYLTMHLISGVLLLAGATAWYLVHGSVAFGDIGFAAITEWWNTGERSLEAAAVSLLFMALAIKCVFPLLYNWVQDAYPEATVTGAVFLSAFTTKLAVYSLARGFAGEEVLIYIGALMAAIPVFFAVMEDNLRRVLAYSLNTQLGFMVVGIGIGTELALNGTAAHAFSHILYKSLLFMCMGAVLFRAGTVNASDLGGLYKSMPWTAGFCLVGAASASAFPLFSAFVSKSLILSAAAYGGYLWIWLTLLFASAAVCLHTGLKLPYFAFFARDPGLRCEEAPTNMLVAMGITAALCVGVGSFPYALYGILPDDIDYQPYTAAHVLSQLQLLMFVALAFAVLLWTRVYPQELRATNLDTDRFYRRFVRRPADGLVSGFAVVIRDVCTLGMAFARSFSAQVAAWFSRDGFLTAERNTNIMVTLVSATLLSFLLLFYGIFDL